MTHGPQGSVQHGLDKIHEAKAPSQAAKKTTSRELVRESFVIG